jgi:hypothetical protein
VDCDRKIDSTTGLSLRCADCEGHGLLRLRKNSCFVSGHGFRDCGKMPEVPKGRLNLAQDAILGTIENLIESRRDG